MKALTAGLPCLALVFLSACSSVSVTDVKRTPGGFVGKPAKIYVADFSTANAVFKIAGTENKDPAAFKKKIADMLATYVVKSLTDHVAPAERTTHETGLPTEGWLVTGEFLRLNTGSRWLRAGIGFGAGGTKIETRVSVTDLAGGGPPFLNFVTTGGSNAMPGAILSSTVYDATFSVVTQAMTGVTDDAARTSRMIAGELNNYMFRRHWLSADKLYSVKKPGEFQFVHEQYWP